MRTTRSLFDYSIVILAALVAFAATARAASPPDVEFTVPAGVPVQQARDVAGDAAGNLYLLVQGGSTFDNLNYLAKIDPAGEIVWSIGVRGDAAGEFDNPQAVAVGTGGRVYVVERSTHRVQYFRSSDGSFLGSFGSRCFAASSNQTTGCVDPDGSGPLELGDGQFFQPTDIATDSAGNVYVADFNNHRIQVLSATGEFIRKFGSICNLDPEDPSSGVNCTDPDGAGPLAIGDGQFSFPQGLAVASDGRIAVADTDNSRVQIFDAAGNLLLKIGANGGDGSEGSNEGELRRPTDLQFDPLGNLIVGDGSQSNRIHVFNRFGTFISRFVGACNAPDFPCEQGDVDRLLGLGLNSLGHIVIADGDARNLKVHTVSGVNIGDIGNFGPAPLLEGAQSVDFDGFGNIFVGGNRVIRVFRPDGSYLTEIRPTTGIIGITGIAAETVFNPPGLPLPRIIVSNVFRSTVDILDASGSVIGQVGFGNRCVMSTGTGCTDPDGAGPLEVGDGQFVNQSKVSIGYDRRIYVADRANHRVQAFDVNGNFLFKMGRNGGDGSSGSGDGEFFDPEGAAAGPDGRIYVADTRNSRVQVFDASGNFLFSFGEDGDGPGQFDQVDDVAVDEFGRVYVADARFTFNIDSGTNRLQVFTGDGEFLSEIGGSGLEPGQFRGPNDVAVGRNGRVAVADLGNNRVQVLQDDAADLRFSKSGSDSAEPGGVVAYQLNASNDGPADARNVVITDELPPELTFLSSSATISFCIEENGTTTCGQQNLSNPCSEQGSNVVCPLGPLSTIDSARVNISARIAEDAQGTLVNFAFVDSDTTDPALADNSDTASTTLVDRTAPVVSVPADIVAEATGPGGAVVTYTASATDNFDPAVTVACSPASGVSYSLGATVVSCTATDSAGNSATATFQVTVRDTTPPTITVPADITIEATSAAGQAVLIGNAIASDIVDSSPSISNDAPSLFTLGTTVVTWTATDDAGNSVAAVQRVSIIDTTAPSLAPPADVDVVATGPLTSIDIGDANASDVFGIGTLTNNAPEQFPVGITEVTWTAVDNNGNVRTAVQRVTSGYGFGGFVRPVVDGGTWRVGRKLSIRIRITWRDGTHIVGLTPTIAVFGIENGELIGPLAVDAEGPAAGSNVFVEQFEIYKYKLKTSLYEPGQYRIFVDLGDGTAPEFVDMSFR